MPATPVWLAAAEAMLNRNLAASGIASNLAARLEGKSMQIDAESLVRLHVRIQRGRFLLTAGGDDPADAAISGSPPALLRLFTASKAIPSAATRMASAQIRGDAEVANQFRELLKYVRPDLEEELRRLIGLLPAHGISTLMRGILSWGRGAVETARANVSEYLQEESRVLVNRTELDEYLRGVDGIREATDRAEARLAELERRMGKPG